MIESMLTTIDNPFSPFDEFEAWFAYDVRSGYHTPSYLARVLVSSDELSQSEQQRDMDKAIDLIVKENPLGIYKKVSREIPFTPEFDLS